MTLTDVTPPRRVSVVGEALVDVVHTADGRIEERPGGSPANVALALGRLGRHPRLLSSLGDDRRGQVVRAWLEESGVELIDVGRPGARTSAAIADIDATGAAHYEFEIDWDVELQQTAPADVVHVGSIAALLAPGAAEVVRLVERSRDAATLTFDPNVRPSLLGDRDRAAADVDRLVAAVDVVKVSDEDLGWLHPETSAADVAAAWLATGPALVVVTEGGSGGFALTASGRVDFAVPAAVEVVDTIGAGDTFMAALIDGLLDLDLAGGDRLASLRALTAPDLDELLARAAAAAAVTVSRPGADPPWRDELAPTTSTVKG